MAERNLLMNIRNFRTALAMIGVWIAAHSLGVCAQQRDSNDWSKS